MAQIASKRYSPQETGLTVYTLEQNFQFRWYQNYVILGFRATILFGLKIGISYHVMS